MRTDGQDEYSGFWGVINSVHEEGFLIEVEGGTNEEFEMLPPDMEILVAAEHEVYEFGDDQLVENVDYEVHLVGADDIESLQ
ncbi:MAG: hypothetical protein R3217_10340 [Gammaproteobacteria bacterium]|nr:hypothetical protein [Gammaproteobacteria bacterium]